ncbi:MAG: phosphoribosylformylglycinamidine cyclo-ligase [Clostridiales bacterium]|jgi:phosphoribosylformylglycinamidine cyclo-ligase|nr:phosphoribosylformylglycinamidine cyclo-ligase [Clostridiales bacterium]
MNNSHSESYKKAGVDITAGYRAVGLIKDHVKSTFNSSVLSDIGGFGGLFAPDFTGMKRPVLVSGTDGVGTKLKVAFLMNKHDTIGIDCVAMCVNDIACSGAAPMFFLDYLALGKNVPELVEQIVSGIAEGCRQAECALIGGETAEMPGFYAVGEYDVAGFGVGIVDFDDIIDGKTIKAGDVLIGVASSGLHSNGFSLVRSVIPMKEDRLNTYIPEFSRTIGEELLEPTRIYVKSLKKLVKSVKVKGIANITGGGFYENIPRMLPDGVFARVEKSAMEVPPVFSFIERIGRIPERDMYNTFNMGVSLVIAVDKKHADTALGVLRESGEKCEVLGEVLSGDGGVTIC